MNKDTLRDRWQRTCLAEKATIGESERTTERVRLADRYEYLGLETAILQLFRRSDGIRGTGVHLAPNLIDLFVTRRDLKGLTEILGGFNASNVAPDRRARAHLALARAYTLLRQSAVAAKHWKELLRCANDELLPWEELADFVAVYGSTEGLGECIRRVLNADDQPPAAVLAGILSSLDAGEELQTGTLDRISIGTLTAPNLVFDLTLAAFRLGQYRYAASSATHGSALRPSWTALEHLFSTIEAFRGAGRMPENVIDVPPEGGAAVVRKSHDVSADSYAWGHLIESSTDRFTTISQPWVSGDDRELDALPDRSVVATFSILPLMSAPECAEAVRKPVPDPMQVLAHIDWDVPHLMYQRIEDGGRLHGFMRAHHGYREWWFRPFAVTGNDLATSTVGGKKQKPTMSLWTRAASELKRINFKECGHGDE